MYNTKFEYKALTRQVVDGKRQYNTPDNGRVPSVTTILDTTKPEENQIGRAHV
jgi:hypothetical protein